MNNVTDFKDESYKIFETFPQLNTFSWQQIQIGPNNFWANTNQVLINGLFSVKNNTCYKLIRNLLASYTQEQLKTMFGTNITVVVTKNKIITKNN